MHLTLKLSPHNVATSQNVSFNGKLSCSFTVAAGQAFRAQSLVYFIQCCVVLLAGNNVSEVTFCQV